MRLYEKSNKKTEYVLKEAPKEEALVIKTQQQEDDIEEQNIEESKG